MSNTPISKIEPDVASTTVNQINKEAHALESSSIINLYELDISAIKKNQALNDSSSIPEDYLRFHNDQVIGNKKIIFKGHAFHPIPIMTSGFELNASGELPRPSLTFASMKGIEKEAEETVSKFTSLKTAILKLNNLIGAKVTRYRTYKKFLDDTNLSIPGVGQFTGTNPEFPREVFYIDRKVSESKESMEFELSSVLDMQNFKLPGRRVVATRCPWSYRGEGCCYEFKESGAELDKQLEIFGATDHLPLAAAPIANDEDELISETVAGYSPSSVTVSNISEYDPTQSYAKGKVVYIVGNTNGLRYFYVSKGNDSGGSVPINVSPPNTKFWEPDTCSKTLKGCKLRWGNLGAASPKSKFLPFGGFPGTNSKYIIQ
tara:strand:+ start:1046 stop:2170 length:1125 start_codon:yes stop_codon:yes gene_type:complete